MKTLIMAVVILLACTTGYAQVKTSTTKTHTHHRGMKAKKYTCPMHPEVVRKKPGKCPKCGMNLVTANPPKLPPLPYDPNDHKKM